MAVTWRDKHLCFHFIARLPWHCQTSTHKVLEWSGCSRSSNAPIQNTQTTAGEADSGLGGSNAQEFTTAQDSMSVK